jgi:hypothetical protein
MNKIKIIKARFDETVIEQDGNILSRETDEWNVIIELETPIKLDKGDKVAILSKDHMAISTFFEILVNNINK